MTVDPGLALRSTPLPAAFALLLEALGAKTSATLARPEASDPAEAVEELALAAGLRTRRVLLDARWWAQPSLPMLARVVDRRSKPRDGEARDAPWGRGWVVLLPRPSGGYLMRAAGAHAAAPAEWVVDAAIASRLGTRWAWPMPTPSS